ncbi:MAG: hypothetical protein AAF629_34950 [Chloroflexota bacterium]
MKIFTNDALIAKKRKQANIVTPVAMAALVGGLITNFMSTSNSAYIPATIALLAVGFIAATISAYMVNHWVKEPRVDQVLASSLKGFDNRHFLFNYTAPAPHVLLTQNKVYTITPKIVKGEISVSNDKWKRKFHWVRLIRFFGEEGLGSPSAEATSHHQKLVSLINENVTDGEEITVEPLILFTHPDVELTIESSTMPIVQSNKLKKYLKQDTKDDSLKIEGEQRKQLIGVLKSDL